MAEVEYRDFEKEEKERARKKEMEKDNPEELNKINWGDTGADSGSKMNKFDKDQKKKKKMVSYYDRQPSGG